MHVHPLRYNEKMTTESVAQSVSNLALSFGDDDADPGAMSRPFGVALLLAGCDDDKVGVEQWILGKVGVAALRSGLKAQSESVPKIGYFTRVFL